MSPDRSAWWRTWWLRQATAPVTRGLVAVIGLMVLAVLGGWAESTPVTGQTGSTVPYGVAPGGVVGLGDSVMAGTNCGCAGIVAEYAAALQARQAGPIGATNLGSNGATTSDLITQLQQTGTQEAVIEAKVVLVVIGANDLAAQRTAWQTGCPASCYQPAVQAMGDRVGQVLDAIARLRTQSSGLVLVTDYWNVFTDGAVANAAGGAPLVSWSRAVTRAANEAICAATVGRRATCVDTYQAFLRGQANPTDLLASDGDHPNARGVALIVQQLLAATPATPTTAPDWVTPAGAA